MKHIDNGCVDCGLPCLGTACPNRNLVRLFCDKCECEASELFRLDNEELCEDCFLAATDDNVMRCDKCGDANELYECDGKHLCWECFKDAHRIE